LSDTIAAVLERDPNWGALPPTGGPNYGPRVSIEESGLDRSPDQKDNEGGSNRCGGQFEGGKGSPESFSNSRP